jgi:hypothetical protein
VVRWAPSLEQAPLQLGVTLKGMYLPYPARGFSGDR